MSAAHILALHDMLVAGPALPTKGGCQIFPCPFGSFRAEQNSSLLPFSAALRLRCVQVQGSCRLTIIATPRKEHSNDH